MKLQSQFAEINVVKYQNINIMLKWMIILHYIVQNNVNKHINSYNKIIKKTNAYNTVNMLHQFNKKINKYNNSFVKINHAAIIMNYIMLK